MEKDDLRARGACAKFLQTQHGVAWSGGWAVFGSKFV